MIWKCTDREIEYGDRVLLMGIVNVTPDSFSDGGESLGVDEAVNRALELELQGADIIDFGAQSTRPGSTPITDEEEWSRLEGVLKAVRGRLSCPVSVDTYYPYVAEKSAQMGVNIINDVSGVISREMAEIVKKRRLGWIIMHNGSGSPDEVRAFFEKSASECAALGIDGARLCFDVGIGLGFGKNYDENMTLIANMDRVKVNGFPLMLGASRKRVIGQGSGQEIARERIYGNIAADTAAIFGNTDIIRLHDVKNEKQGILMASELKKYKGI